MPAFASLEDVLRYFLYEESGIILDAGADKLEESLILHNVECIAIGGSSIALATRREKGFAGELVAHRARDLFEKQVKENKGLKFSKKLQGKTRYAAPLCGMWVQIPLPAPLVVYLASFGFFCSGGPRNLNGDLCY